MATGFSCRYWIPNFLNGLSELGFLKGTRSNGQKVFTDNNFFKRPKTKSKIWGIENNKDSEFGYFLMFLTLYFGLMHL